jgi:flavin reductase (DIM6/NTAB) family NADH-FMN oxidoreductase RutF
MAETARPAGSVLRTGPDIAEYRRVLGQYPTGVVVVTAMSETGEPLGMTVGSFGSASLDPPLVVFLPDKSSSSWAALRSQTSGRFGVNVLGAHQEEVCRKIAVRKNDKFDGIEWRPSDLGSPIITGSTVYLDCIHEDLLEAGDHHIVVGRVDNVVVENPVNPLLFYRGGYGSFTPGSLATGESELVHHLRDIDLVRPLMARLADEFRSEVTSMTVLGSELILTASAGIERSIDFPTRVGQRMPFMPPVGGVFAAWGDERACEAWLEPVADVLSIDDASASR